MLICDVTKEREEEEEGQEYSRLTKLLVYWFILSTDAAFARASLM